MAFRLSILISILLLGIGMLYLRKKEGWEWDKIISLFTVAIIIITICGSIGIYIYIRMSVKPEVQTSFWEMNLSSSKQSVLFIKGPPIEVTAEGFWIYESKIFDVSELYYMKFIQDQLRFVGYLGDNLSAGPGIQGIKKGSSFDAVITLFGKPTHISESKDGFNKLYSYEKYNVFFIMNKNIVTVYGIYNPKYGLMKIE